MCTPCRGAGLSPVVANARKIKRDAKTKTESLRKKDQQKNGEACGRHVHPPLGRRMSMGPGTVAWRSSPVCAGRDLRSVCRQWISRNLPGLKEELGDLLFQVVFLSQMMQEQNAFTLLEVLEALIEKMISRHPHVFGNSPARSPEQALQNWESMKDQQKAQTKGVNRSILDGIPVNLPALQQALMISSKVVRVGFEWETEQDVWRKLEEEIQEFKEAGTDEERAEELGDILFTMVNIARKRSINPEDALRMSNEKFRARFGKLEKRVYEQDKQLSDLTLAEMDLLWEEIKKSDREIQGQGDR